MRKYKRQREKLYILTNKYGESVHAICEEKWVIIKYKSQFKSLSDYNIMEIDDKYDINRLYFIYGDQLYLEEFVKGIILTQFEINYYNKQFKEIYDDTRKAICQLYLLNKIVDFSISDKSKIHETFEILYGKCSTYEDFINSLDESQLFNKYIMDPILCADIVDTLNIKM